MTRVVIKINHPCILGKRACPIKRSFFLLRLHDRYGDLARRVARYTEVKVCDVNVSKLVSPPPPGGMGVTTVFEPGGGGESEKKWNVQFYFQPPTFYFAPPPLGKIRQSA